MFLINKAAEPCLLQAEETMDSCYTCEEGLTGPQTAKLATAAVSPSASSGYSFSGSPAPSAAAPVAGGSHRQLVRRWPYLNAVERDRERQRGRVRLKKLRKELHEVKQVVVVEEGRSWPEKMATPW